MPHKGALGGIPLVALVVALALLGFPKARAQRPDRVSELIRMTSNPSYKVRLQAVVMLGKLHERRALPALLRTLGDESEAVRGMAAEALGELGDQSARGPLTQATRDRVEFVRTCARTALRALDGAPPPNAIQTRSALGHKIFLVIGRMGDKTGRASGDMRERMREYVIRELKETPYVTLYGSSRRPSGFAVDGAIKELSTRVNHDAVDITCEVELIISNYPSRSIVMMTTGSATVQTSRIRFRPAEESSLSLDALQAAVRGAHENLIQFLQANR